MSEAVTDYRYEISTLWIIRVLMDLGCIKRLHGFADESIYAAVGWPEKEEFSTEAFAEHVRQVRSSIEKRKPRLPKLLEQNLRKLASVTGLDRVERQIIAFAVLLRSDRGLEDTTDYLGVLSPEDMVSALSRILQISKPQLYRALSKDSLLVRSGLLGRAIGAEQMQGHFGLIRGLSSVLQDPTIEASEMLSAFFSTSRPPRLSSNDFPHASRELGLLTRYLSAVQAKQTPGANILIYGPPGTGKTEYARVLASCLGCQLMEISMMDGDGDPSSGRERFRAFQLSQITLARKQNTMVLFDEIEDVFPSEVSSLFGRITSSGGRKAWVNQLLEENPVPAIWISNSIEEIDKAYLRRFAFVFRLDTPPKHVRKRILEQELEGLKVSSRWIETASENASLAPAIVARAADVVRTCGTHNSEEQQADFELVIGNTLEAMGYGRPSLGRPGRPLRFSLAAVNADVDLTELLAGLSRHPHGRFCLYGPPGTGKTEFGRFVAERLQRPLLVKRASDLLGPYVGQTEQQIAQAFAEAAREGSVLMLDEADSLLRDRGLQSQSWEISRVNEVLTQMESFDGLLFCSTNLIDDLDSASARRFDLKIKLDYLSRSQARDLFREAVCQHSDDSSNLETQLDCLSGLANLTPGDFATVLRRLRLIGVPVSADRLLEGLVQESAFKGGAVARGIGFTASEGW